MTVTLVLGGARSGKTRFALREAEREAGPLVMIATAQAFDEEMAARIARHRAERGARWRTVEAPLDLAGAVDALSPGETAVIDCMTLWISNLMHEDADVSAALDGLSPTLRRVGRTFIVSNEVGLGIVPDNALARRFRDEAGFANQRLAAAADRVVFVAAGLPLVLK